MSELLQRILQQGFVKELPQCEMCKDNEQQQKEHGQEKAFLLLVGDKMLCGNCVMKVQQGKTCYGCKAKNNYNANFCINCGMRFGGV